jgi:S1-C subfamily serine protease
MRNVHRVLFALVSATLGSLLTFTLVTCKSPKSAPGRAYATTMPSANTSAGTPLAAPTALTALTAPAALTSLPSERARTEDEQNTITVFARTAQACVFVTQQQLVVDYWARRTHEVPAGSGSGFVWDTDGHVVTNYHVVADAQKLTVTLQDQRTFVARVVGVEPRKDIAVLKIDAPAQALVPIARHAERLELEVGQKVIAIGNPFGLDQTLTTGIVSALGRQVDGIGGVTIREMVQTDAAINPGNSGGPLIDSTGRLIGMNTMIYSRSGSSAGIGFAVPVQTIERVVPQLIRSGKAEQVGLGIEIDPQQRIERRLGMRGVVVITVSPDSPAKKAGLQGLTQTATGLELGDVIVAIDKKPIQNYDDLYNALDGRRIGETVVVTLIRGRKPIEVSIPLVAIQ